MPILSLTSSSLIKKKLDYFCLLLFLFNRLTFTIETLFNFLDLRELAENINVEYQFWLNNLTNLWQRTQHPTLVKANNALISLLKYSDLTSSAYILKLKKTWSSNSV